MTSDKVDRFSVIDIGSNSVRLVIYEISGMTYTPIHNEKVSAGLGRNLHITGKLHPEGRRIAFGALKRFKILIDAQACSDGQVGRILIAATAALRDADDADGFIAKVSAKLGFDIHPLSGQQEAYMSAMGVLAGDSRSQGIVADLGGASLELIEIVNGAPLSGSSYPLGPFSLFNDLFDPSALRKKIIKCLPVMPKAKQKQDLYLIGGAWRNLALIHQKRSGYPLRVAHNYQLGVTEAQTLAQWAYSLAGIEEIKNWRGLSRQRADTLPYSGLLLEVLLDTLAPRKIIIAPGGLREGLVYDALSKVYPKNETHISALLGGCIALAKGREHRGNLGDPLFAFLGEMDKVLPRYFTQENENRLRRAACMLSGIGKGLHPNHKARMAFRAILYAPLPDLNHEERAYLALMVYAAYTSKLSTPNDSAIVHLLSPNAQISARRYGQAMRIGLDISGRSYNILSQLSLSVTAGALCLSPRPLVESLLTQKTCARLDKLALDLNLQKFNETI